MTIEEIIKEIENDPIEKNGQLYHPIPFEEFSNLNTSSNQKAVYHKWNLIKDSASKIFDKDFKNKQILDIGANAGFYSFNFSKLGSSVLSYELLERYSRYATSIIKEKDLNVEWHQEHFNPNSIEDKEIDLTLMLSVFQWMAEGGSKMDYATNALRKVSEKSEYLIFELSFNKGKSHIKTNKWNSYGAMINLLKENSTYTNFKLLGKTKLWRSSYRYLILCSRNQSFEDTGFRKLLQGLNF